MEITEVKVFPVRDKKLRAFVSIVFDGSFMVNDIKVIQGKDGFFISMPSRRKKNGRFKDIAHPLNQETRQALEERIVAEYRRVAEDRVAEDTVEQQASPAAAEEAPRGAAPEGASLRATTGFEPEGEAVEKDSATDDKSLEEVAEHHLSDSYWTT